MTLTWHTLDRYHTKSECGRFTVCRANVQETIWYEAYRGRQLLGATRVPITASEAERGLAISAMKALCEAEAGVDSPPTTETPA